MDRLEALAHGAFDITDIEDHMRSFVGPPDPRPNRGSVDRRAGPHWFDISDIRAFARRFGTLAALERDCRTARIRTAFEIADIDQALTSRTARSLWQSGER